MTSSAAKIIVIGASAGALEALMQILPVLPADYPVPVVIVVHLPPDKASIMAELFDAKCALAVKEAEDKEDIKAGTIYFAPPNYHVLIEKNNTLSLSSDEEVLFSRPSIDVLFESAADAFAADSLGIILTGANSDGANGARLIADAGGQIWVQDSAKAYASAMPEAAAKKCPHAKIMSLADIAVAMQKVTYE